MDDDILYDEVAKIACCSMHQFGRVFSYIVGLSLSEYIRRRRLTLSAITLLPSIAEYFNVSVDELLGLKPLQQQAYIKRDSDNRDSWNGKTDKL